MDGMDIRRQMLITNVVTITALTTKYLGLVSLIEEVLMVFISDPARS